MCVCVNVYVGVCLFVCLLIRVSPHLLGWLAVCVHVCLCVFLHPAGHFRALFSTCGYLCVLFLYLGGPWNSIVTLGTPLCQPWWSFLHDFCTWWDLGAQFADFWPAFGRPCGLFLCIFTALGPDPAPFRL